MTQSYAHSKPECTTQPQQHEGNCYPQSQQHQTNCNPQPQQHEANCQPQHAEPSYAPPGSGDCGDAHQGALVSAQITALHGDLDIGANLFQGGALLDAHIALDLGHDFCHA